MWPVRATVCENMRRETKLFLELRRKFYESKKKAFYLLTQPLAEQTGPVTMFREHPQPLPCCGHTGKSSLQQWLIKGTQWKARGLGCSLVLL